MLYRGYEASNLNGKVKIKIAFPILENSIIYVWNIRNEEGPAKGPSIFHSLDHILIKLTNFFSQGNFCIHQNIIKNIINSDRMEELNHEFDTKNHFKIAHDYDQDKKTSLIGSMTNKLDNFFASKNSWTLEIQQSSVWTVISIFYHVIKWLFWSS